VRSAVLPFKKSGLDNNNTIFQAERIQIENIFILLVHMHASVFIYFHRGAYLTIIYFCTLFRAYIIAIFEVYNSDTS